ncbi:RNA-directed DNA polymerase, eukaryota, reverse transcriptase zinc-binding domain protein [Tanacetum coccineum]
MNMLNWKNGNLFTKVLLLKDRLKEWHTKIDGDPFNTKLREEAIILKQYKEAMIDEHKLLAQKAKIEWLKEDVPEQFLKHFQQFLGTESIVHLMEECDQMFSKKLSEDEIIKMIQEVTYEEIKIAMFDIDNDKAPGPDGFTSCFFKTAWNIIGLDICAAFKEFFHTGKLLKEVNATLISLIPKMSTQNKELLKGYNRRNRPKRCALKIDLQKAYDTVVLCFKGARSLRQGGPMSPYLFTLVMEVLNLIMIKKIETEGNFRYHSGRKELQMTHLCFADDIMGFYNGDVQSDSIVKKSLNDFSNFSRLLPNLKKA